MATDVVAGWGVLPSEASPSVPLHGVEREVFLRKVSESGAFACLPSPLRGIGANLKGRGLPNGSGGLFESLSRGIKEVAAQVGSLLNQIL